MNLIIVKMSLFLIFFRCECKKKVKLVNYNLHTRSNCSDFFEMENNELEEYLKKKLKYFYFL